MFRIAICDDEQVICSQIENIIMKYAAENNEKIDTQVFYSGEELSRFLELEQSFDLIFLDIELKLINGIEVGKKIRDELDNQILQIVYISGKDSYFKDMFDVRPMHFLQKPFEEADIIKDVRLAMKLMEKLGGVFIYKKGHEIYRKPIKNILYFESNNREVKMVTRDGEETFYGKLDDVYQQVAKYHFMYIHKSYVVNYFFVMKFKYEEVTMSNDEVLPISQARRKATRELQVKFEKEGFK
ncbi:MAG: LytTR family DNA-binding domain-containing protein [Eubacteriales bacterium]|nr:LytTR family DNA-binding domain-containing protein [Eubacteriales bacterium]